MNRRRPGDALAPPASTILEGERAGSSAICFYCGSPFNVWLVTGYAGGVSVVRHCVCTKPGCRDALRRDAARAAA